MVKTCLHTTTEPPPAHYDAYYICYCLVGPTVAVSSDILQLFQVNNILVSYVYHIYYNISIKFTLRFYYFIYILRDRNELSI